MKFSLFRNPFVLWVCLLAGSSVHNTLNAQTIIWSEDFEEYMDGDTIAQNFNTTNPSIDWSYGPGSMVNKVFATNPISENLSFYHRQGTSTWMTETIDISSYSGVSISLNLNELTCENGDKIETFYILDGNSPIEFGHGNGDGNFNDTVNTVNNLNGNTLVLSIITTSDSIDDKHRFDNILIQGFLNTTGADIVTACDSFTWMDGNTYTSSNNTATDTLVNSMDGDSIVTLNLTILNSTSGVDTISACDSLTWINGITYTSSTDLPTWTLTNSVGCDSVVALNLTINSVDTTVNHNDHILLANTLGASYQWLDCNNNFSAIAGETNASFTAVLNGDYAVEVMENGCIDTSACYSVTTLGIIKNSFGAEFSLYPNPTRGSFSIEFGSAQEVIKLNIMDASGRSITRKSFSQVDEIDYYLEQPIGVYVIEVSDSNEHRALIRLVKE